MSCYVFGPVPSRRLGRSLGVDLIPLKTCTYDCIYCQLPRTSCKTTARKEWVPLEEVLQQLKDKLASEPDYITLSGSGEPTLYSRIDELIGGIKQMTDIPLAILTNGSLLGLAEVRSAIQGADLVMPSLDAGDEQTFRYVNRPVEEISFQQMVDGLVAFRQEYKGQYWLEVLLLAGISDTPEQLEKIARIAERIGPDRIQLNTVTRPPLEKYALAVPKERLHQLAAMFGPKAEVIAEYRSGTQQMQFTGPAEDILEILSRRPCTVEDLVQALATNASEVVKYLGELSAQGWVETQTRGRQVYYLARRSN